MGNKMRQVFYILVLSILTICIFSSSRFSNLTEGKDDNFKSIYQFSNQHCGLGSFFGSDSVVLTRNSPNYNYDRILIYRNKKLIFEYSEENLEVIAFPHSLFIEHQNKVCKEWFYIFKLFGGHLPDYFLIISTSIDKTYLFGKTITSTAEIFGDVDYDGKFEIGGFEWYCEADDSSCSMKNLYSVFEIDEGFPIDTTLTNYFKKFLE